MKKLTLAIAIILASSCSYPVKLPVPQAPHYPKIDASELQCLSDRAYEALVRRDMLKDAHIQNLTDVIESTR